MGILNNYHHSWDDFITNDIINELNNIENQIGNNYFPKPENVLRILNNDLNKIKYIIVGMEPYPSSYVKNGIEMPEATGRSFEVSSVTSWAQKFKQSSLRNIIKTIYYNYNNEKISLDKLREKINNGTFKIAQPKEWFDSLENQGILFLNATLTVEKNNVDTHTKIWEHFMNELISFINKNHNVIWILWGKKAQNRVIPMISNNYILTSHPRLDKFIQENCFGQIPDIDWTGLK